MRDTLTGKEYVVTNADDSGNDYYIFGYTLLSPMVMAYIVVHHTYSLTSG